MPIKEEDEHALVVQYLKDNHEGILFKTDLSGIRMPIGLAKKVKKLRSDNGYPDIEILEPVGKYSVLFIELKRTGTKLYKKNGEPVKNEHFAEQRLLHEQLNKRGYYACFAVGYQEAVEIIEKYFKKEL